ncbi:hypothetical protein ACO2RV_04610 [Ancylobacter sp. VNQ12]|uniref:hypothetical protein n=1 Tax=Ancylobacter sp. VNQ12 TaxID=3400920 RepID=UPI003C06AD79
MAEEFDLFGMPILPRGETRGRPKHAASLENRNRVNMLLALGWSNDRIAGALGITLPTFRKHYFSELKYRAVARDRLDMRRAELLWRQVEGGNVGAMREFGRLVEKNDTMRAEREMAERPPPPQPERLGKKVVDKQRAMDADAELTAELEREASHNARH